MEIRGDFNIDGQKYKIVIKPGIIKHNHKVFLFKAHEPGELISPCVPIEISTPSCGEYIDSWLMKLSLYLAKKRRKKC